MEDKAKKMIKELMAATAADISKRLIMDEVSKDYVNGYIAGCEFTVKTLVELLKRYIFDDVVQKDTTNVSDQKGLYS